MQSRTHFYAYAALVSVCIFWGTTYLAIRMALESFPPMFIVATRYVLSGSLLLAAAIAARRTLPRGAELRRTALYGVLVLSIGNGALVMAETWIPSGLAALIITLSPFWLLGMNAVLPPREHVRPATWLAMLVGLAGAALLVGPGAFAGGWHGNIIKGFLMLQLGTIGWNYGSLLQRRMSVRAHPIVSGGVQQLAAGIAMIPLSLMEHGTIHWTTHSSSALLYLVLFGSIVGYSSFIYAMEHLPIAVVSIYNYINPLVAVFLGWLFYREPFGWREAMAMIIIFMGVALVKRFERT